MEFAASGDEEGWPGRPQRAIRGIYACCCLMSTTAAQHHSLTAVKTTGRSPTIRDRSQLAPQRPTVRSNPTAPFPSSRLLPIWRVQPRFAAPAFACHESMGAFKALCFASPRKRASA